MIYKFRAWDIELEIMCKVIKLDLWSDYESEKSATLYLDCEEHDLDEDFEETRNFDEIILMQYTGLKDKNGVEIYEGDVIKYELFSRVTKGVVKWCDTYNALVLKFIIEGGEGAEVLMEKRHVVVVIGNIHDNMEVNKLFAKEYYESGKMGHTGKMLLD